MTTTFSQTQYVDNLTCSHHAYAVMCCSFESGLWARTICHLPVHDSRTISVPPAAALLLTIPEPVCGHRGRLQKIRVICTGALTNVALLVSLYPEVVPRLEVVLMGGAMGIGNTGPVMEFNIQVWVQSPCLSVASACRGVPTLGCGPTLCVCQSLLLVMEFNIQV